MNTTVIKDDNFVQVDGVQKSINLDFLPATFHALQYDGNKVQIEGKSSVDSMTLESLEEWDYWSELNSKFQDAADFNSVQEGVQEDVQAPTNEDLINWLRAERNHRLFISDVEVIRALESGSTVSDSLKLYRQKLRDLPNDIEQGAIAAPVWNDANQTVEFNNWPNK